MFPNRLLKFIILIFLLILTAIFSGCGGITTPGIPQDSLNAVITANPTSGEAPLGVTFDGSGSSVAQGNEIVSYEWDFGDGKTGEGGTVHHGFDSPGNYTVILTISDNKGAVDISSVIIKVFQPTETVIEHNFNTQNGTEFDTGTGLKIIVPPSLIEGQMNLEVKYDSSPSQSASDLIKLHSNYSITITPQKGFQEKELITSGMNKDQETTKVSFIFDVPEDVDPQSLAIFEWSDEGWYLAGAGDIETIEQLGGVLSPDDKYISIEVPFENSLSTPAVMNTNTFSLGNFIINKIDFLFAICPIANTGTEPVPVPVDNGDDIGIEKKVYFWSLESGALGYSGGIPYKVGISDNSENLIDKFWDQQNVGLYTDIVETSTIWYLMPSGDDDKKGVLTLRFGPEGGECTVWLKADEDMLALKWVVSVIPTVEIARTLANIVVMYIKETGNFLMEDSVDTGKLVKETRKMLEELEVELVKQGISLFSIYGMVLTLGAKVGELIANDVIYWRTNGSSQNPCGYKNPGYWEWKITVPPMDNNPPIISDLTANTSSININQTTTIICSASDPDGDSLTYTWTKTGGTFEGNTTGPTITWRAPSTPDTYTVECEVSDGKESDSKSVDISVGEFDINGDITNVSPLTDPFTLDTWYTTNVYVKNTGNTSHTFKVKTSEPSGTDFEVTEKSITLSAGSTNSVSFKYKFYGTETCRSLTFILYDSSNILLDTYTTETLCQTGSTLGQVQLLSPSNGATLPLGNITFSWNSVSNATKYQFILYNSQGQVALDTIKTSTSAIVALNTEETITWKVRAGNNSVNWGAWSSIWSLTLKSTTTTTPSFTGLTPSQISTSTAPYQAVLSASGSNFNNVNRITFNWSGAASGSATWYKGDTNWNTKVTVNSDTSMTLKPGVVEANPTWSGTVYWTVTLRDATGATASRSFTVTYTPPSTTSATIDSYSPSSKITINTGESFTIKVWFTNTGDTAAYFYAGASVWDSNGSLIFDDWGGKTYLNKGQQGSASWGHTINTPGEYWLQFGVWNEAKSELLDKKPSPSQNLIKVTYTPSSPSLSFTDLTPSQISTSTAPYQAMLSASGSNFNNVNRVSFSWSGAASGSATWNKGDANWNAAVKVKSDNSMTLQPIVVETNPTWSGTVYWTVTLRDNTGATASRSFTVTYTPKLSFTGLAPSQISTSTAPYDATLSASGSSFNNVNRVSFSWSGAASGSATWYKGDTNWNNKVTVNSDSSMTLRPRVVETNPTWSGKVYWTVTLRDNTGATASRSFTVTYAPKNKK